MKAAASAVMDHSEGNNVLQPSDLFRTESKARKMPNDMYDTNNGTPVRKSEDLERLGSGVHLHKRNLRMYGEKKKTSKKSNSQKIHQASEAIRKSKGSGLASNDGLSESASGLNHPMSDDILDLTFRKGSSSLAKLQEQILGKDCVFYSRISDPGTPGTYRDFACATPSVPDNHLYKKVPGWGRSSIMESQSPACSSPLNQDLCSTGVSSPGTTEPLAFDDLSSPHLEALSRAQHCESPSRNRTENFCSRRDQEYFSCVNYSRYRSIWEKSTVRGSYDSDLGPLYNSCPEPIRRGRSEVLTMCTDKKQPQKSKTFQHSRSVKKMDAGSLIYMLGTSSSSLKAKKIAEILRE